MLRELRASDADTVQPLLRASFPEQEALLGTRPEAFQSTVRRIFQWDARIALGLLRLVRRPAFYFFVVEEDHRVVGTTLLTFRPRAGHIAMVMVDPGYRRKGFARMLLSKAETTSRSLGRPFTVLDVLTTNTPARALYASHGYAPLRELAYLVRELTRGDVLPGPAAVPGLRRVHSRDFGELATMTNDAMSRQGQEVLATRTRDFHPSAILERELASETEGWVVETAGRVRAYLRANSSELMSAGHLSAPAMVPGTSAEEIAPLAFQALGWLRDRGAARAVVEVPVDQADAVRAMTAVGFREAFRLLTLYRPTAS